LLFLTDVIVAAQAGIVIRFDCCDGIEANHLVEISIVMTVNDPQPENWSNLRSSGFWSPGGLDTDD